MTSLAMFEITLADRCHQVVVKRNQAVSATDDKWSLRGTVVACVDYRSVLLVIASPKAILVAHLSTLEQKKAIMDHVSDITKKTPYRLVHRSTYVFYPDPRPSYVTSMLSELDRELFMVGMPSPKRTSFATDPTEDAVPFRVSVVYNGSPSQCPRVWHRRSGQRGQDITQLTASAELWIRIDGLAGYHRIAAQLTETSIVADEMLLSSRTQCPSDTWILRRSRGQPYGWTKEEPRLGQGDVRVSVEELRHKLVRWSLLPRSQDMFAASDEDTKAYAARVEALERTCGKYCT